MFDLTKSSGLGRRIVLCGLAHGAALLNDVVDLMLDDQAPRALSPAPFPAELACEDCGVQHGMLAAPSMPPELAAALAARRQGEPQGSALVRTATWVPAFASEVKEGALLGMDGPTGRRAMRVVRRRLSERQNPYGFGAVEFVTFLLVDAESGEPGSLTVPVDEAVPVAVEAPESLAEIAGGAA